MGNTNELFVVFLGLSSSSLYIIQLQHQRILNPWIISSWNRIMFVVVVFISNKHILNIKLEAWFNDILKWSENRKVVKKNIVIFFSFSHHFVWLFFVFVYVYFDHHRQRQYGHMMIIIMMMRKIIYFFLPFNLFGLLCMKM